MTTDSGACTGFGRAILNSHFGHIAATGVTMLNSGSFGISPESVIERKIQIVRHFESYGDEFVRKHLLNLFTSSVQAVADLLKLAPGQCTIVDNVTTGVSNLLSLFAKPGDAILVNSWTYGSVKTAAELVGQQPGEAVDTKSRRRVFELGVSLPIASPDEFVGRVAKALDEHPEIRVAIFDHITSATACVMPVHRLAQLCRTRGCLVIIDGAHAIGQLPGLDIAGIGADFYVGNLHKWLFVPKSAALVWASESLADSLRPSVVSWLVREPEMSLRFAFLGTRDASSALVASDAVAFVQNACGGLERIHAYCSQLADEASQHLIEAWGTHELPVPHEMRAPFMRLVAMPEHLQQPEILQMTRETKLMSPMWEFVLDRLKMDVLLLNIEEKLYIRISFAVIVCMDDIRRLADSVLRLTKRDFTG